MHVFFACLLVCVLRVFSSISCGDFRLVCGCVCGGVYFFVVCGSALRVPPAETRLTVYRRLYIRRHMQLVPKICVERQSVFFDQVDGLPPVVLRRHLQLVVEIGTERQSINSDVFLYFVRFRRDLLSI